MTSFSIERDDATAAFFDAAREGRLLIRRCVVCRRLHPPQQERCADSDELEWVDAAGTGTLVTWSVDHGAPPAPELLDAAGEGAVIGIVELAEGPWLNAALPGVDPSDLSVGMPVHVEFVALGGGEPVPVFVPTG